MLADGDRAQKDMPGPIGTCMYSAYRAGRALHGMTGFNSGSRHRLTFISLNYHNIKYTMIIFVFVYSHKQSSEATPDLCMSWVRVWTQ